MEFGPPGRRAQPEYPFWWLQSDDLWEVEGAEGAEKRQGHADPKLSELRRVNAKGGFLQEVYDLLTVQPELVVAAARQLLDDHFPPSLHEDLAEAVHLALRRGFVSQGPARDPEFRDAVLNAYAHRCAVCDFDGSLGDRSVGLEAAHVQWFAFGGPSTVANGLGLCALHHKLFDLGVLGISTARELLISSRVAGSAAVAHLTALRGRPLRPRTGFPEIGDAFIAWHAAQVFKAPAL
ncbi:MAG: hypothetical protein JNK05_13345 [Myxococcales bacterium]|nr:hypothetical protein [Myxococcales bacterium]